MSIVEKTGYSTDEQPADMLQEYLQLQQSAYLPTAVELFSQWHDSESDDTFDSDVATLELAPEFQPVEKKTYRELIPVGLPGKEEQFAFEVDLAACSGCKSCVAACHSMNGLGDEELWREVGMLKSNDSVVETFEIQPLPSGRSEPNSAAVIQHVTSACHHCDDPGCLNGCPVKAYEKDPLTGIVRHLDDQCIGCQYCTLMCPYEVPKYDEKMGIVRKCDMCHQRLAVGEAPACVQACPNEAIAIRIVSRADVLQRNAAENFLPDSPPAAITNPTTVYKNQHRLDAGAMRADQAADKPQHSHFPLAAMLVVTQLAVGMFVAERFLASLNAIGSTPQALLRIIAFSVLVAGIHIAPLHLGRPLYAFRAFLNFKTSWLSREIIVFGKLMGVAGLYVAGSVAIWFDWINVPAIAIAGLGWTTVAIGIAGVCCSAMVYVATKRPSWSRKIVFSKFFLSSFQLGFTSTAMMAVAWNALSGEQSFSQTILNILSLTAVISILAKIAGDMMFFRHLKSAELTMEKRTALLMKNQLKFANRMRFLLSGLAVVMVPFAVAFCSANSSKALVILPAIVLVSLLLSELFERWLFFTSVIPFRMPGIQH